MTNYPMKRNVMQGTMKCAIVDDEPLALGLMESYVLKTPGLELAGKYSNAVMAMAGLQHQPVDLLFLDIQMPDLSGLDLSRMIDTEHTRVVFTTAFSEYALEGYKVNALDYLLKPISYTDFVASVSRAQRWKEHLPDAGRADGDEVQPEKGAASGNGYFYVKSEYRIVRVDVDDILYVEGLKDYVKIRLVGQERPILTLMSMRAMEEELPGDVFFRVHRSFIVNMQQVRAFEKGQIVFGEKRIPVSDSYRDRVNAFVESHLVQGR